MAASPGSGPETSLRRLAAGAPVRGPAGHSGAPKPAAASRASPSAQTLRSGVTPGTAVGLTSSMRTRTERGNEMEKLQKSDAEWRSELTREQYDVLRNKGTERAFTGAYWDEKTRGAYRCAGCG